jgi:myosin heavy subunit
MKRLKMKDFIFDSIINCNMSEHELRIAKISSLLNSAIREKNSKAYKKALSMLQQCNPKPSLQEILNAQAKDSETHRQEEEKRSQKLEILSQKSEAIKNESEKLDLEELTLKELEDELDNLRKQDPNPAQEKTAEEIEQDEENRIQEVIKRYEKTFGRIKGLGSNRSSAGSAAGKSIVSSRPSKVSKTSDFSTASQREAFEKLKKLQEEEEKIKKEKEDLMKFLELRSNYSKGSSRPVTVSSIVSRDSNVKTEEVTGFRKKLEPIEEKREDKAVKSFKPAQPVRPKDEVGELLKSLY